MFVPGGKNCRITSIFPPVTHLHFFGMKTYRYNFQNIFCLQVVQNCPWYGMWGKWQRQQQNDQQCSCFIEDYMNNLSYILCICSYDCIASMTSEEKEQFYDKRRKPSTSLKHDKKTLIWWLGCCCLKGSLS